jgi:hypothetical protein
MNDASVFSGVGVVGMSWTLRVAGTAKTAAQPAITDHPAMPQRKRRAAAAATVASVNRGIT